MTGWTRRGFAALGGAVAAMSGKGARAESDFEVALTSDVMVAMRDGVKLATDVYRPARDGRPVRAASR
jgi:predicted acyl esterase